MEPFSPIEPPPPAYGEEQDLDRKIADALDYSLQISPHSAGRRAVREERGGAKQAAYRRHLPHPEKLRLRTVNAHETWHTASPTSPQRAPSTSSRRLPTSPLSPTSARENPTRLTHRVPDNFVEEEEEESPDEQLPAFTERGPALDGPPYSQAVRVQPRHRRVPSDSPPQSPLDDDEHDFDSQPRAYSTPHPRRPSFATSQRSTGGGYVREHDSGTMPPKAGRPVRAASAPGRPPHIPFNPAMAYATDQPISASSTQSRGTMEPSALYSSAVSSLYVSPSRPQLPKKYNTLNRMPSVGTVSYASHIPDPTHPSQVSSSPHASAVSPGPLPLSSQGNLYGTPTPPQRSYSQRQSPYSSPQPYQQQQPHTPQRQPHLQHLQQHASPTQQQQPYVPQQYASPAAPWQLPYTPPRY